jgi:hypothetical protein
MTKQTSKYSADQVARIQAEPVLNQAVAARLAAEFGPGFTTKSVIAKITRMELPYQRKLPTTKSGDPVESKATIVAELATLVEGNLDGLDKAPKPALQALRNALRG